MIDEQFRCGNHVKLGNDWPEKERTSDIPVHDQKSYINAFSARNVPIVVREGKRSVWGPFCFLAGATRPWTEAYQRFHLQSP
jgi:hypothetical protein